VTIPQNFAGRGTIEFLFSTTSLYYQCLDIQGKEKREGGRERERREGERGERKRGREGRRRERRDEERKRINN
jgi:hypothetical protein